MFSKSWDKSLVGAALLTAKKVHALKRSVMATHDARLAARAPKVVELVDGLIQT